MVGYILLRTDISLYLNYINTFVLSRLFHYWYVQVVRDLFCLLQKINFLRHESKQDTYIIKKSLVSPLKGWLQLLQRVNEK